MITSPVEKLQFTITGLPQVLPITFAFGLPSDLLVLDGTNLLTISSDYLVTGGNGAVGNVQVAAGGAGNVQVGDIITVMRNVPLTQLTDFTSTGVLTAAMIGQALDKLTEITQQLSEEVGRCLRFPPNENEDGTMGLATRAGLLVGFDASGNLIFTTSAGGGGGGGYYTGHGGNGGTPGGGGGSALAGALTGSGGNGQIIITDLGGGGGGGASDDHVCFV